MLYKLYHIQLKVVEEVQNGLVICLHEYILCFVWYNVMDCYC